MGRLQTISAVLLVGVVLLILSGCSGSGAPAEDIRGGPLQALAVDNVSAVTTLAAWTKVFYMPVSFPEHESVFDPATGLYHLYGTTSDGAAFEYYIDTTDNSSQGTIKWPDGEEFRQTTTASYNSDYTSAHEEITNTYPNGAQLQFTVDTQFGPPTLSHWVGTATLPGGRHLTLRVEKEDTRDKLVLTFGDGARLEVSLPIVAHDSTIQYGAETTGIYRNPQGQHLTFRLAGATRWDTLQIEGHDGSTGSFRLQDEFQGAGELRTDGEVAAALRWDAAGLGILDIIGASQTEVTPSAAARDFRIDRWTHHAVGLGPQPMY